MSHGIVPHVYYVLCTCICRVCVDMGSEKKISSYRGAFLLFFALYGALLLRFYPYRELFSSCGGLFNTFFSMWGAFLSLWRAFFGACPSPPPRKVSAGAHVCGVYVYVCIVYVWCICICTYIYKHIIEYAITSTRTGLYIES